MQSRWNDEEARAAIARHADRWGEDLALRVYTSRLLGADTDLVLHGGGNTSVKTEVRALDGSALPVLYVKGSGHDLASAEPEHFPALELAPLRDLCRLEAISDTQMLNEVRRRKLDSGAPDPSVEALLHASLPHRFVDHTHADAVLQLTDQPDADWQRLVREALGNDVVVLDWVRPGFALALAVAGAHARHPEASAIVLRMHGLFTFADDARQSYERMIELVDRAERFVDARIGGGVPPLLAAEPRADAEAAALEVMPVVRGALARETAGRLGPGWRRMIGDWRGDRDLVAFSQAREAAELVGRGPVTPDHLIRTKSRYLFLTRQQASDPETCRTAADAYAADYERYFGEHRDLVEGAPKMFSPEPRVVLVEGCGVFAFGPDRRAARIAGDIAEHTVRAIARATAIGTYTPLDPAEQFCQEYWLLEVAKLGSRPRPALGGQVGLVTGAAGAIGHGIADELLRAGACVVVTDLDTDRLEAARARLAAHHPAEHIVAVPGDVTDAASVDAVFAAGVRRFGGVDIVVPNAGIAWVSQLADLDLAAFRKVVDVNMTGTLTVLQSAARLFAAQGTGGCVVVQSSKNVFDPGAGFGAYSASKAGAHQLGKIAALELASLGVRVNMVNADAVFGDDETPSGLWQQVGPDRMKARGLDPEGLRRYYRERSLLGLQVSPAHVGQAVVFFASGLTPTTGATLPVDAGIPGAFPR